MSIPSPTIRPTHAVAIALLSAAVGLSAAEDDLPDSIELQSRIYGFEFERNVNYDDEGELRNVYDGSDIRIKLMLPDKLNLIGYKGIDVDTIIYIDAEDQEQPLPVRSGQRLSEYSDDFSDYVKRNGYFSINIPVDTPPFTAKALKSVKGSVTLIAEAGKSRALPMSPVKDWMGKRLALKDLDGGRVTLTKIDGRKVHIDMSRSVKDALKSIAFLRADGTEIQNSQSGYSSSGDVYDMRYSLRDGSLPEDGKIVLTFYGATKKVTGTFHLQDVPLSKGADPATPITLIELKEVEPPPAAAEDQSGGGDQLEVEVEVEKEKPTKADGF